MFNRALLATVVLFLTANFTIVRLQTPPSSTAVVNRMNSNGYVAGFVFTSTDVQGVAWKPGGAMLQVPLSPSTTAYDINDAGTVVGRGPMSDSFVWQLGASTASLIPRFGGSSTRAYAINAAGDVAGGIGTSLFRAVIFRADGSLTELGDLGGGNSIALAIANEPLAAGQSRVSKFSSEAHAFVWIDGAMTDLGSVGGADTYALGVMATNWPDRSSVYVIGNALTPAGAPFQGFLWKNGVLALLPTPPGTTSFFAAGINHQRHIVGSYTNAAGEQTAVMWTDDGPIDLNTWLPPGSGWVLSEASAINDAGQIAGIGYYLGQRVPFLITP